MADPSMSNLPPVSYPRLPDMNSPQHQLLQVLLPGVPSQVHQQRMAPLETLILASEGIVHFWNKFIPTELPRVEIQREQAEAVKNCDAVVVFVLERFSQAPRGNSVVEHVYKNLCKMPIPEGWFSLQLRTHYSLSFDMTLPVNKVIHLPFGPTPEKLDESYPRHLFCVCVDTYEAASGQLKAPFFTVMRAVLNKVTAHNLKGKLPLVRRLSVMPWVKHEEAATQMAQAYHQYLQYMKVPNTPLQLRAIEDPFQYLLSNIEQYVDEQILARGILKNEVDRLLGYATKEAKEEEQVPGLSDKLQTAALRVLELLLKDKTFNSSTIAEKIATKTEEQLNSTSPSTRSSWFLDLPLGVFVQQKTPQLPVCLQILLELSAAGKFRPWVDMNLNEFLEVGQIGSGSFSIVKEVRRDGVSFAKKEFCDSPMVLSEKDRADIRKEVALMCLLKHPNLVTAIGANLQGASYCVIMLKAEIDLFHLLHKPTLRVFDRKLETNPDKRKVSKDVVHGLEALHKVGIVHRDVKSMNVLMTWSKLSSCWNAQVADFGTARTCVDKMSPKGSIAWMAPEVLNRRPFGKEADIYSYGVILWEIWSNKEPDNLNEVWSPHQPLAKDISSLVKDCLNHTPADRPSLSSVLNRLSFLS